MDIIALREAWRDRGGSETVASNPVKFSLTDDQELRLLGTRARRNLSASDRFNQRRMHMNTIYLVARVAQSLLAVTATVASVLVFQW
jgi:hypothetical protein